MNQHITEIKNYLEDKKNPVRIDCSFEFDDKFLIDLQKELLAWRVYHVGQEEILIVRTKSIANYKI